MPVVPPLCDLLNVALEAAYLGGRRTLAHFNTNVAVETKADQSPVTIADREAEEIIRARILKSYSNHAILGEEAGATGGSSAPVKWIIDPIDGTKTFICGVPFYGVLIGVEVLGKPSVGVIYMPAFDEMVSAAAGLGCHWNGRAARVSRTEKLADAVLLTTSATNSLARSDAYGRLVKETKIHRTWGDCYGYVLVATGRADIMLDPAMNPWDCAPMLPIMAEAGGFFGTWQGEATIWGKDGFACNAALKQPVLDILKTERLHG